MVAVTRRFDDDEGVFDDFDPAFWPKRVYKDGRGPRVRLMMTDGRPDWTPPTKPMLFDARNHRPHYADLSDASLQDGLRAAVAAYEKHNKWLQVAWRTMGGGPGGTARTTAPPADKPGESARDAYVRRISSWPPGSVSDPGDDDDANAIETRREAWLKPGARPGGGYGDASAATRTATKDAVADRDQAYGEYLDRISNGWRR
jgi:hypothetical protein